MKHFGIFHPNVGNHFGLDDDDIDRIQEILDESFEDDDDDVQICETGDEFPKPIKVTQKNVN